MSLYMSKFKDCLTQPCIAMHLFLEKGAEKTISTA